MAHSIESILITVCQNGLLYRVYNNNCVQEWLTILGYVRVTYLIGERVKQLVKSHLYFDLLG